MESLGLRMESSCVWKILFSLNKVKIMYAGGKALTLYCKLFTLCHDSKKLKGWSLLLSIITY